MRLCWHLSTARTEGTSLPPTFAVGSEGGGQGIVSQQEREDSSFPLSPLKG